MKYYVFSNYEELDKIVIVEGEKALLINKDPLSVNTIEYKGGDLFEFLGMGELGSFYLNSFEGNKILLPINHLYDEVDDLSKYENFKAIELNLSDIKNRDNYYISDFIRKEILEDEEEFK